MRILDAIGAGKPKAFTLIFSLAGAILPSRSPAQQPEQDRVAIYASAVRAVQRQSPGKRYALLVLATSDTQTARKAAATLNIPVVTGSAHTKARADTVMIQVRLDSLASNTAIARVVVSGNYKAKANPRETLSWFILYRAVLTRQNGPWVVDTLKTEMES